ncbi:LysR family transcriptional regulator [Xanthomonas campestris]|uniref:LysR family transcriptional regulator n=1 Tax=Xanthomonas campestris TaxID=339 RepID=UPI0023588828|nr:LysR family transcriptional regulator [Xanthomonas campestris]MDC8746761.1 LysR family transcriptional regulator [Xanthomonas campestris]
MNASYDRFAGIEPFVVSARSGGFTAAATRLGLTPSGVAKAVSRLEARLGLKLFHRTTRRLTLTAEGEAYLAACQHAMSELEQAELGLAPKDREPSGRLRIELPAAFGRRHVLPRLFELANRFGKLDLSVSFSERTVDLVKEAFDLAVRIGHLGADGDLVARKLGTQRLVLCASPDYIARHGILTSLQELAGRDCLTGPRRADKIHWIMRMPDGRSKEVEVSGRHDFSDGEAMLAAGLAGCGIMQMPTWLVGSHLRDGSLVELLDAYSGAEMPIHAVWPKSHYIQPKLRAAIDLLVESAKQPGLGFQP